MRGRESPSVSPLLPRQHLHSAASVSPLSGRDFSIEKVGGRHIPPGGSYRGCCPSNSSVSAEPGSSPLGLSLFPASPVPGAALSAPAPAVTLGARLLPEVPPSPVPPGGLWAASSFSALVSQGCPKHLARAGHSHRQGLPRRDLSLRPHGSS